MPSAARPAAKHTACCSAMPTSKHRSGNLSPNRFRPVPDGIAAVIATMRSSFSASAISDLAKTVVYCGAFGVDRADIIEAEFFEQCPAGDEAAGQLLCPPCRVLEPLGEMARHFLGDVAQ